MKSKEVPQDNSSTYGGETKLVYAINDDGGYAGIPSSGWEIESFATRSAVEELERQTTAALKDVQAGTLAPLGYHMLAKRMDMATLSSATGFGQWRIKRHLKPAIFADLPDSKLQRYADVLDMPVDAIKSIPENSQTTDKEGE